MKMTMLFISHNLAVVKKIADYVCIMKDGKIVEQNTINEIFLNPKNHYTKELIQAQEKEKNINKSYTAQLLKIDKLKVWYPIKKGLLRRTVNYVKAVNEISIDLNIKETLGIVGESGSGKTSLVLALLKLIKSEGIVRFENKDISKLNKENLRQLKKNR